MRALSARYLRRTIRLLKPSAYSHATLRNGDIGTAKHDIRRGVDLRSGEVVIAMKSEDGDVSIISSQQVRMFREEGSGMAHVLKSTANINKHLFLTTIAHHSRCATTLYQ